MTYLKSLFTLMIEQVVNFELQFFQLIKTVWQVFLKCTQHSPEFRGTAEQACLQFDLAVQEEHSVNSSDSQIHFILILVDVQAATKAKNLEIKSDKRQLKLTG